MQNGNEAQSQLINNANALQWRSGTGFTGAAEGDSDPPGN